MLTGINILKPDFKFNEMREQVLKKLATQLPVSLTYHSYEHTLNVEKIAEEIAIDLGLSKTETLLIKTAALYHDLGFIHQHEHNEALAIQMASTELLTFNYAPNEINLVCEMIHSTRVGFDARNIYDQIISDADHDYFGRTDYFEIATKLRKEFSYFGKIFSEIEWCEFQLNYLENHHEFLTTWAVKKRNHQKQKNIKALIKRKNELST